MSSSWTFFSGFPGDYDSLKTLLRKNFLLQAALCLALCLGACGDSSRSQGGPSPPSKTTVTGSTSQTTLAPIIAPPDSGERPLQPGSLGRTIAADGLPTLQPPKGINVSVDTLFTDDIKDPIERSRRLETAVVEMRRDLDAAMPAIKRLVAIEKDIQLLSSQLETLLNGEQAAPEEVVYSDAPVSLTPAIPQTELATPTPPLVPVSPAPEVAVTTAAPSLPPPGPEPVTPKVAPPPPPIQRVPATTPAAPVETPLAVLGLRLGEHPDRTRLVFDMTGPATFRTDLDNNEKLLIVEIEKAAWSGMIGQGLSSPLVQSYTVQPMEGGAGTRVIMTLKAPTSVTSGKLLAPDSANKSSRLVIDLAHE